VNAKARKAAKGAKAPMSNKKYLLIWTPVLAFVAAVTIVANVGLNVASGWVESQLGSGTYTFTNSEESAAWDTEYYTSDYADQDEVDAAAKELVEDIADGGIVLAKNQADTLPLTSAKRVTMLGRAAADPVFGGAGSGSVDTRSAVTARAGLENAGFEVNDQVFQAIADYADNNKRSNIVMDNPGESTYYIGEMPVDGYEAQASSFADYSDAAVIFIGRPGGEGGDLTQDMTEWDDNAQPGQHQLELNKDERDMIALAEANFDTVVVVVNASTTMELGDLQGDPKVDAILLAGSPGATGFNAVGSVLNGDVNPSGRTVDVWAADFTADPTFVNFGNFIFNNLEVSYPVSTLEKATSNATITSEAPFVNYAEGIYVGYRYYETAAAENFIDYSQAVVYPFGYGLSYTSFKLESASAPKTLSKHEIATISIDLSNTGSMDGEEVLQIYVSYPNSSVERPRKQLKAFRRIFIEAGKTKLVKMQLKVSDLAYWDVDEPSWKVETGPVDLIIANSSRDIDELAKLRIKVID